LFFFYISLQDGKMLCLRNFMCMWTLLAACWLRGQALYCLVARLMIRFACQARHMPVSPAVVTD